MGLNAVLNPHSCGDLNGSSLFLMPTEDCGKEKVRLCDDETSGGLFRVLAGGCSPDAVGVVVFRHLYFIA